MAYADDVHSLEALRKARLVVMVIVGVSLVVSYGFEVHGLDWLRALLWAVCGGMAVQEARLEKRIGRNSDSSWLRATVFFLAALVNVL